MFLTKALDPRPAFFSPKETRMGHIRRDEPHTRRSDTDPTMAEIQYTVDEREFLMAVDWYKRDRGRPFPTNHELLEILYQLGWRKVAEPKPLEAIPRNGAHRLTLPAVPPETTATPPPSDTRQRAACRRRKDPLVRPDCKLCGRPGARTRNLCRRCYLRGYRLVQQGEVTWDKYADGGW